MHDPQKANRIRINIWADHFWKITKFFWLPLIAIVQLIQEFLKKGK
ncbi:MAG: hypothetical protein GF335_02810 [Candidatus Moranbacteria bacterium]|nr:hypothetical protein [Candidatus Moranbacteria bacterium]